MKSNAYIILGLLVILLLGYTYAEDEIETERQLIVATEETVDTGATTIITPTTTTSTGTTTTSVKTTTTTTTTIAPLIVSKSKPVNIAKPKTTTTVKKKTCNSYCKNIGYEGGECRLNGLECRVRNEVKTVYGGRLCPTARLDTCCCQTEDSVDKESKYSYTIREPIEPLLDNGIAVSKENRLNPPSEMKPLKP